MSDREPLALRLRQARLPLLTFAAVMLGLALGLSIHKGWLLLAAAGLFGPGLLRELGLLSDRDEFQLRLAQAAGHRAYLAGGLGLVLVLVLQGWSTLSLGDERVPALALLVLMLMVYLLSTLFQFWGARRAAGRILVSFGAFWLVFVLLSHAGEPKALLMELLVPLPFFLLAWGGRRWPRVSGLLLLGLSGFAFFFFSLHRLLHGEAQRLITALLLFLPLLASALGYLLGDREDQDD